MKKILSFFIIMLASLNLGMHVYAAESKKEAFAVESTKAISGYGERYTGTGSGYFEVNVTGNGGGGAGITIKNTSNAENAFVNYSIMEPDGSYLKENIFVSNNSEKKFQMWFTQIGTYKIYYYAYTPDSQIFMQCWIYG